MMGALISLLCGLGQDLIQIVVLLVLAPLLAWPVQYGASWLSGMATGRLASGLRRHVAFWTSVIRNGLSVQDAACLAVVVAVAFGLPMVTTDLTGIGFADPLALGVLLLAVRGLVVSLFSPVVAHGRLQGNVRTGMRPLLPAFLVLCLIEALIALCAPGADGIGGLCAILHIEPGQGLEGGLASCAMALALACPPLRQEDVSRGLSDVPGHEARENRRMIVDLLNATWVIFLSDIALPSTIALGGSGVTGWAFGLGGFVLRLGLVTGVLVGLRLAGQERSGRLTALFAGLGLLIALAGRFAT